MSSSNMDAADLAVTEIQTKDVENPTTIEAPQQSTEVYDWSKFRPSCICGCFNFVLQLVLLASIGSFLFGLNISLLNTAVPTINSAYQQCGKTSDVHIGFKGMDLAKCKADNVCKEECIRVIDGEEVKRCPGGYNDLDCDSLKWYNAFLSCAILIGGAIGSMTGGNFMSFGRRGLLLVTMVIYAVGIISSVCANSFSALMWARLIVGYAVGLTSVTVPTYMSEVTPAAMRGKYGVFHQLFVTVGILVGILIGLPLTDPTDIANDDTFEPEGFQQFWWRFMLGLGVIPVILNMALLMKPYSFETPVYYVEKRRYTDAASCLRMLYDKQDVDEELNEVIANVRAGEESKKGGLTFGKALADSEYRYVIIVGCILSMCQQFGGINVFMTSSSDIFRKAGLDSTMQTVMSIVMAAINVLMTFPTIYLIEKMGRRSLLFWGSLMQFVMVVPAAVCYWTESDPENDPSKVAQILAIVAVLGFVCFFAVAFGPVVWVYLFEIYPMEIKDVAAALATALNWVAGIIMVFVSIVTPNQISFTIFAIMQLLATLFIFFFMRETRGLPLGVSPYITKK